MSAMMEKLSAALEGVCEDHCLPRDTSIAVRAILQALREPSDAMQAAGVRAAIETVFGDELPETSSMDKVRQRISRNSFTAMIDAILEGRS